MNAKVHIPHVPTRYDPITNKRVPSLNLTPAGLFGELNVLLPDVEEVRVSDMQDELSRIRRAMFNSYSPEDFICCVGDPVLLAATLKAAAGLYYAPVKVLRWDRSRKTYIKTEITL